MIICVYLSLYSILLFIKSLDARCKRFFELLDCGICGWCTFAIEKIWSLVEIVLSDQEHFIYSCESLMCLLVVYLRHYLMLATASRLIVTKSPVGKWELAATLEGPCSIAVLWLFGHQFLRSIIMGSCRRIVYVGWIPGLSEESCGNPRWHCGDHLSWLFCCCVHHSHTLAQHACNNIVWWVSLDWLQWVDWGYCASLSRSETTCVGSSSGGLHY